MTTSAIIFAAGRGSRLGTLVDAVPALLAADWAAAAVVPADWASRSGAVPRPQAAGEPRFTPSGGEPTVAYASWRAPAPLRLPEVTPLRARPMTGADNKSYRLDVYIVQTTPTGGRPVKQVTLVIRDATNTSRIYVRQASRFDQSTG